MGGKPAEAVVDSDSVETILRDRAPADGTETATGPVIATSTAVTTGTAVTTSTAGTTGTASTTFGYLSAPPIDPAADVDPATDVTPEADRDLEIPGSPGEPADTAARPTDVTETLIADTLMPEEALAPAALPAAAYCEPAAGWDASDIVTEIYTLHYNQLVRLALLLLHNVQEAEEVVQDAFEAMHVAWRRLRESEKALAYLRQTVVNKSRSALRHRKVVDLHPPKPAPDEPSAEHGALALIERSAVVSALRQLPVRQREAIVLRYYADLSEADIAQAMGISRGAVKSHTARAMAALKSILTQETP